MANSAKSYVGRPNRWLFVNDECPWVITEHIFIYIDELLYIYTVITDTLILSPDEWATTKQACRDEIVV